MAFIDELKLRYPVDYIGITRGFTSSHKGVDLGWSSAHGGEHQAILAPADGTVISVINTKGNTAAAGIGDWGNLVKIDHGGSVYTLMAHLLKGSVTVKIGEKVNRGQRIGNMNNSGYSFGSHCHYEVYLGGSGTGCRVDPMRYTYVYATQLVSDKSALKGSLRYHASDSQPISTSPVILTMGFASEGDVKKLCMTLESIKVKYALQDGIITTDEPLSAGDQRLMIELCNSLHVPCQAVLVTPQADLTNECDTLRAEICKLKEDAEAYKANNTKLKNDFDILAARIAEIKAVCER